MSDDVLKIIPTDPHFVPDQAAQDAAVAALEALLPEGEMCEAEDYGHVNFIDQGENVEALLCPSCGTRQPFYGSAQADAVSEWWQAIVEDLEDGNYEGRSVQTPCCSAIVPITSLRFDWPAGFARFELSIWNPGIGENLPAERLAELEEILGCKLQQVRAHY